jgi:hypothetical protein
VKIQFKDHLADLDGWAKELGISREAVEIYSACEVVDLHIDTFLWKRMFGYDLAKRHGRGPFGGRLFYQVDLPRLREARIRTPSGRRRAASGRSSRTSPRSARSSRATRTTSPSSARRPSTAPRARRICTPR